MNERLEFKISATKPNEIRFEKDLENGNLLALGENWRYKFSSYKNPDDDRRSPNYFPSKLTLLFKDRATVVHYPDFVYTPSLGDIQENKALSSITGFYEAEKRKILKRMVESLGPVNKSLEELCLCIFGDFSTEIHIGFDEGFVNHPSRLTSCLAFVEDYRFKLSDELNKVLGNRLFGLQDLLSSIQLAPFHMLPKQLREIKPLIRDLVLPSLVSVYSSSGLYPYTQLNVPSPSKERNSFSIEEGEQNPEPDFGKPIRAIAGYFKAISILEKYAKILKCTP